jgi:DNA-binding transcriptional MocR family regulator
MNIAHKYITGRSAVNIAASIEQAVRSGDLPGGQRLPTVRDLAGRLGVCPATVAAAYNALRTRGLILAHGRRGTRVSHRPVVPVTQRPAAPAGTVDLADGNPDPALLPDMAPALRRIDPAPRLYGDPHLDPDLVTTVRRSLLEDGVACGSLCVVNGAMDGIDRVLAEHLRPGDRVAVEDPSFSGILDLVMSRGLPLEPVRIDGEGLRPDDLARACAARARAVIVTPRAYNPTGAAMTATRARELRRVLGAYPDVLIIENDHTPLISDVPLVVLHDGKRRRWAHVCSFSKALNPDLRLAVVTGDDQTLQRVHDRLVVGERWVSHILQRTTSALLADSKVRKTLRDATRTYTRRRRGLVEALSRAGVTVEAASGYNVWIPVAEETATVQALLAAGWAVAAGERFRIHSPPAIRVTAARLETDRARDLATALASGLRRSARTAAV